MTATTTFGTRLAALALTVLVSATRVLGAVGPATPLADAPHHTARAVA